MLQTGFPSIDNYISRFTNSGGSMLLTGDPVEFVDRMFINLSMHGRILVYSSRTKETLSPRLAPYFNNNVSFFEGETADKLIDNWHCKPHEIVAEMANCRRVHAVFVNPGSGVISEGAAWTSRMLGQQFSPVIHWCNGPIGTMNDKFFENRGQDHPYDIHLHCDKLSEMEYDVSVTSFISGRRSGICKVVLPKQKTRFDKMTRPEVETLLYDIHLDPSDPKAADAKQLLGRWKELTGQSRPGFMK